MKPIELIIKAIDEELELTGKEYLILSQANKLLVNKELISNEDVTIHSFKKILESNIIPHAYQTSISPKQWRIPHSKNDLTLVHERNSTNKIAYRLFILFLITAGIIFLIWILSYKKEYSIINGYVNITSKNIAIPDSIRNLTIDELYNKRVEKRGNSFDCGKFEGKRFTYISYLNDKELNGEIIQTNHEITYHTFDFINKKIIFKANIVGGEFKIEYVMKDFYEESGIAATTYVVIVNSNGVKEIWFSPDVPNLGYDYSDGTRIACYELSYTNK